MYNYFINLETERLFLRKETMYDAQILYKEIFCDFHNYKLYHPILISNEQEFTDFFGKYTNFNNGWSNFIWIICLKESNEVIGLIHLQMRDILHNSIKLGYIIGPRFQNKGYVTEASKRVVEFAFLNLGIHRIEAEVVVSNIQSEKVLQKIKMNLESHKKESYRIGSYYYDQKVYSIINNINNY